MAFMNFLFFFVVAISIADAYIHLPLTTRFIGKKSQSGTNIMNDLQPRTFGFPLSTSTDSNDRKWDTPVEDEFGERIESVKSAVFSAIGGSIAVIPFVIFKGISLNFNAEWEFSYDSLLILTSPLFGIVFRYCVRRDNNPQLKQGVIGAFAITRALATIAPPATCTSIPLNCGPPFYLFTGGMLFTGVENLLEAGLCFTGSAYLLETLFKSNVLSKFPKLK